MSGRRWRLGLLAAALPLAACGLLGSADPPVVSSVIDALPARVPRHAPTGSSILVFAPEARAMIGGTQMAYTRGAHEVAYFARHRWAETPAQMLQPLLLHTLEATGAFAAVLAPPATGRYGYGCQTEILDLVQDFTQRPPQLRIELRVRLSDGGSGQVLATRDITVREPMRQASPEAGVIAANAAAARALQELAGFVLDQLP